MKWNDVQGLGRRMKALAKCLSTTPKTAAQLCEECNDMDEPYIVMTLMRLSRRGIAQPMDAGGMWVRGETWEEAARVYKWPH